MSYFYTCNLYVVWTSSLAYHFALPRNPRCSCKMFDDIRDVDARVRALCQYGCNVQVSLKL